MLTFHPTGDIRGPTDHLNKWTTHQWKLAYRQVPDLRPTKRILEGILDDMRAPVQEHDDLLNHPGRTSCDRSEQRAYWRLYSSYYSERLPAALERLNDRLDRFWAVGAPRRYAESYPGSIGGGGQRHTAWVIIKNQYRSLVAYYERFVARGTDVRIRDNLNPTGRGALCFSLTDRVTVLKIKNNKKL